MRRRVGSGARYTNKAMPVAKNGGVYKIDLLIRDVMYDVVSMKKFPPHHLGEPHPIQASLPRNNTDPVYHAFPTYEAPLQRRTEFERHQ